MELQIEYGFEDIADAVGRSERSTNKVDLKEISEFLRQQRGSRFKEKR